MPVAQELIDIWKKALIPTQTLKTVASKVEEVYKQGRLCERTLKSYTGGEKLFDICACTCPQVTCEEDDCKKENCEEIHIVHSNRFGRTCRVRIDPKELPFLMDQRGKRQMFIGGVHQKDTITLQRREERLQQV